MRVSALGLSGSFGIDADSVERAFHELGVNYFFFGPLTAGINEGIRRLIRQGHREQMVLAAGAMVPTARAMHRSFDRAVRSVDADRIDVWHLYWVRSRWYVRDSTWSAAHALKGADKVRALAVSCHDRLLGRALVDELDLDVLMVRYNAAHRGAEREVFADLGVERPGIVTYTATRWGTLLRPVAGLGPMSAPECYRFATGHPKVDVTLCGPESYAELAEDVRGVLRGSLPEQQLARARMFGDAVRAQGTSRGLVTSVLSELRYGLRNRRLR